MSAGFALTHPSSVTDITAIEAVRVEELDEAAVSCTSNTGTGYIFAVGGTPGSNRFLGCMNTRNGAITTRVWGGRPAQVSPFCGCGVAYTVHTEIDRYPGSTRNELTDLGCDLELV